MDFSSTRRALESLARRQPPLDERALQVSARLLLEDSSSTPTTTTSDFLTDLNTLLFVYDDDNVDDHKNNKQQPTTGGEADNKDDKKSKSSTETQNNPTNPTTIRTTSTRWEPLAVGLYLATEALQAQIQRQQQEENQPTGTVYMDGPRVPSMTKATSTTTAAAAGPTISSASPVSNDDIVLPTLSKEETLSLCQTLHKIALKHLEHNEPRVRTLVAKAVGAYAKVTTLLFAEDDNNTNTSSEGNSAAAARLLRTEIHSTVVTSIRSHIETGRDDIVLVAENAENKQDDDDDNDDDDDDDNDDDDDEDTPKLGKPIYSKSSTGALDDTTGWRALETNWQCLASIIVALGPAYYTEFLPDTTFFPQVLEDCQYSCLEHVNRHVRAASYNVLEQLVVAAAAGGGAAAATTTSDSKTTPLLLTDKNGILRKTVTACLKAGLADNWSQVRMAASVLCRVFFTTLQGLLKEDEDDMEAFADLYRALLPPMCLNRFYLAQGVKLYSHETWKIVFQTRGVSLVVRHLPAVCRYYVKNCDADNHVVREAACQAIAELGVRLSEQNDENYAALQPLVPMLLQALLMCFHDESWPVRDEACLACGLLCRSFPEECRPELKTLWERWTEQLTDTIWSVREDAAVALGDALDAYGDEFLVKVRTLITELLPSARKQPAMTQAEYKARQNSVEAHTDAQLYSCGSLAPKLSKGRKTGAGRIGGCSSCEITRDKAPWEATDGCIYLIREVVIRCGEEGNSTDGDDNQPPLLTDKDLIPLLTELADVCRVRHFPQGDDLRTTLWRQLPLMARALGKNRFKRHYMEIFMELLFYDLDLGQRSGGGVSQLAYHAAGQCAEELGNLVGPAIFRGRLEEDQRETLDKVLRERACMPRGPPDDFFSPYGPPGLLDAIKR